MAILPPNLDDGELYLPSDIFPGELPSGFSNPLYSTPEHARMAELARRFASFSLMDRQRARTASIPAPIGSFPAGYLRLNGDSGFGRGNDAYSSGYRVGESSPVWLNRPPIPVQPQVGFRAMVPDPVLVNREARNSNRVWPLKRSGTGVFLPRVGTVATTTAGGRRRQSVRNRQDIQVATQRSSMPMADLEKKKKKQEECHYHLPPDMNLPQDWTY